MPAAIIRAEITLAERIPTSKEVVGIKHLMFAGHINRRQ
jgi:hypothetical protein